MGDRYHRTAEQKQADLADAKAYEQQVGEALRSSLPWAGAVVDETSSTDRLDFWVPGYFVEVKEKKQPLTARWTKHTPDVLEANLFVLDELTVRRAMRHWPYAFFLLRDRPHGRLFVVSVVELAVIPRVRVQRVGKGKLLFDLTEFHQIANETDLPEYILGYLASMPWKASECVGGSEVPQV